MKRLTISQVLTILALPSLTAACGDSGSPTTPVEVTPVATELRVPDAAVTVRVPQSTSLTAVVYDQKGRAMTSLAPAWTSRDPSTATVTSAGVVTAVETGDAWIVATAAGLSDSVSVRVRFPIGPGESRMRVRGPAGDATRLLRPWGRDYDLVGTASLDRSRVDFEGSAGSLVLIAQLPTTPGEIPIQAWSTEGLLTATIFDLSVPGAYYADFGGDETVLYLGESGYLEVTAVQGAVADGDSVTVAGHIRLRASGYDMPDIYDDDPVFVPTGDTVVCDLDFHVSYMHQDMGYARVRLQGGPIESSAEEMWEATVDWPNVIPPETPLIELKVDGAAELTAPILSPQVGTLVVQPPTPGNSPDVGTQSTSLRLERYYPYFLAVGTEGTLTLDRVDWPTSTTAGELSGSLVASLLYWLGDDPPDVQTGTVSMEFHALWPPKPGAPSAAEAVASPRSPWSPLLAHVPGG